MTCLRRNPGRPSNHSDANSCWQLACATNYDTIIVMRHHHHCSFYHYWQIFNKLRVFHLLQPTSYFTVIITSKNGNITMGGRHYSDRLCSDRRYSDNPQSGRPSTPLAGIVEIGIKLDGVEASHTRYIESTSLIQASR